MTLKFVWGITGAGDFVEETIRIMKDIENNYDVKITVIISKQGELVLKWYKLFDEIKDTFDKVYVEIGPNKPFLAGPLQRGKYKFLFICPTTSNTVAKIVHGIGDTLITNCVSQTIKGYIPVYIYPVDQKLGDVTTILPNGKELKIRMRKVDLENTLKLKEMEGIQVLSHPNEIIKIIENKLK